MLAENLRSFVSRGHTVRIETPTDAVAVISNDYQLDAYIAEYGNVPVGHMVGNVYRVPMFDAKRERFRAAKLAYCEKYGCE